MSSNARSNSGAKGARTPKKYSEKDMEMHREYMKKYKMQSSDLDIEQMKYRDHYQLLDIERSATHSEIRQAYRKLALKYHPDRNSSAAAQERWEGVPAAYAVLSNPNDRAEYDATLETRDALVEFYKAYNPAKLDNATIQTIIDGWYGREVELFQMLNSKYEIAPHQGTNRALKRTPPTLSHDRARAVASDSVSFARKQGDVNDLSWTESLGSVVCCKGVWGRLLFSKSYYEVETKSPGFIVDHGPSNTPGQGIEIATTMQSPAIPDASAASPELLKPSDRSDRASTATTMTVDEADGRPTRASDDTSCSSTPLSSSTSSGSELPPLVTPTGGSAKHVLAPAS